MEVALKDTNSHGFARYQCLQNHPKNASDCGYAWTSKPVKRNDLMFPVTGAPCSSFRLAVDQYFDQRDEHMVAPINSGKEAFLNLWQEYRMTMGPAVSYLEAAVCCSTEVHFLEVLANILQNWHYGTGTLKTLCKFHDYVSCIEEMPTGICCRRYMCRLCHRCGIFEDPELAIGETWSRCMRVAALYMEHRTPAMKTGALFTQEKNF